jgi:hypothetical protein
LSARCDPEPGRDGRADGERDGVIHGDAVQIGQPLFTLHAQAPGKLACALAYVQSRPPIVQIDRA